MATSLALRTWHKRLGYVLAAQVLIWCVGGLYMTSIDIDFIRGDTLVRSLDAPLAAPSRSVPLAEALRAHPGATAVKLRTLPDLRQLVYEIHTADRRVLIEAATGRTLSPLTRERIEKLATAYYAGEGGIARVELIGAAPVEIRGREPPLWRVDFDDDLASSFYLDPDTGALVTRRHRPWRIFDAFWMLHIMDYGYERDDMNNLLLRVASAIGLVFAGTGLWLLAYSFRRRARTPRAKSIRPAQASRSREGAST